jgi:hypothetical protein
MTFRLRAGPRVCVAPAAGCGPVLFHIAAAAASGAGRGSLASNPELKGKGRESRS